MQTSKLLNTLTRWLVPLAALAVFIGWIWITPPGILGKADAIGYAVCHRIGERSFHIGGAGGPQMPLCARCNGTFAAAAIGLIFQAFVSRKQNAFPHWKLAILLAIFIAAWGFDGANSYLYLIKQTYPGKFEQIPNVYIPNNVLRLLTGSGMGLAMSIGLYPALNQTIWREADPRPAMDWRRLGILIVIMLLLDAAILTEHPVVMYPVAFLSVGGVLALLTCVFGMVWIMIMRQENSIERLQQLGIPALAGFTLTLIMIMVIDLLRFRLTGTWGGYPLG
jgi:uncharacterized membrane protein